jgi:hypothetical protein
VRPDTIETVLNDVLAACTDAFGQEGANKAPERMFVTHGQPVVTSEQLVVWSPGVRPTKPFPLTRLGAIKDSVIPGLDVTIELWRSCWPVPKAQGPTAQLASPEALTKAALSLANDAASLFGYVSGLAAAGTLFPSLPTLGTSSDVALLPLVSLAPQGALAGWRWPVALKLAIP